MRSFPGALEQEPFCSLAGFCAQVQPAVLGGQVRPEQAAAQVWIHVWSRVGDGYVYSVLEMLTFAYTKFTYSFIQTRFQVRPRCQAPQQVLCSCCDAVAAEW